MLQWLWTPNFGVLLLFSQIPLGNKGALVDRLRTEIGLHPGPDSTATPFDLANLPSCLRHDIFRHGVAAVVPTPKISTLSWRDAPRIALANLSSIYADERKGAKTLRRSRRHGHADQSGPAQPARSSLDWRLAPSRRPSPLRARHDRCRSGPDTGGA